jgi:hypothetical protein
MNGTNNMESYLLLGFGRSYIDDCKDLIETLRHFNDNRPINIVVLPSDVTYAQSLSLFDRVMSFDIHNHPLYPICGTKFERFGLLPRLELYKFLHTEYTIVLDTDILCSYYTNNMWNFLKTKKQELIMLGSKNNSVWHWGHWGKITSKINIQPQETHGGLFFLNKSTKLQSIFEDVKYCFLNYDKLGMLRLYQGGAVDECCFSYAFSKHKLSPVEFAEYPIMTFDIDPKEDIPTKNMTENIQKRIMDNYIPFIHMFQKNHSYNFKTVKQKILQYPT